MMTDTLSPLQQKHRRAVASALNAVLGPARRADVRELVAAETGARRASPRQMLSWMRVNMPSAADRVDDVMFPEPFRD
jgi:hypothetical protein